MEDNNSGAGFVKRRAPRLIGDKVMLRNKAKEFYATYAVGEGELSILDRVKTGDKLIGYRVVVAGGHPFVVAPGHIKSMPKARTPRKPLAQRLAETFAVDASEIDGMIRAANERKAVRIARLSPLTALEAE